MDRLCHLRPAGGVDAHPIASVAPPPRPAPRENRDGTPGDIRELAGGIAQSRGGGIVAVEQRRKPTVEQVAMFGKARRPPTLVARGDCEWVLRAGGRIEILEQQSFAQAIGGYHRARTA
jgi:hypothetical protein